MKFTTFMTTEEGSICLWLYDYW